MHAYLRIIRIPIAKQLGGMIISGERIHHNGDFKIDQFKEVLETYHKLCNVFGVELLLSVKDIKKGDEIKNIIGYKWEQGKNQFSCVFSGNYRDKEGKVIFDKENILKILNEFIYPSSIEIVKKGYEGDFRYIEIVKNFI
jgi:ABC-type branched-subunit amino acid transport system ATPase component